MKKAWTILVGMLAVLALTPAAATASKWTVTQVPAGPVQAAFYGVDCPSRDLCVAVGGNETIAASSDPSGGAPAWRFGRPRGGEEIPGGEGVYGGGQMRGVSCPSLDLCVAASFEGEIYTSTDPAGSPSAWKVVELGEGGPNVHMLGVSCPSVSFCVAVAYGGKVVFSRNPAGAAEDWVVTQLQQPYDLRGVSCPTVSFCAAVGNEGEIVVSSDPTGGPGAWRSLGAPAGANFLNGISCPSPSLCVTGNAGQMLTSISPDSAGSWNAVSAGTGLPITASPALW